MSACFRASMATLVLFFASLPIAAAAHCNCAADDLYAMRLVVLDNPATQTIVESHPLMKGTKVVTVFVRTKTDAHRAATDYVASSKLAAVTKEIDGWAVITIHESIDSRIDYTKMLSIGPKTLVDSMCEYGKRSGFNCRGKSKGENCVDSGASANRCSDRNDFGCGMLFWSWGPPTGCKD